jgi:hypothetical protein
MPGFDGSGPRGRGPGTGRGFGRCGAVPSPVANEEHAEMGISGRETGGQVPADSAVYGLGKGGVARGCGRGNGRGRFMSAFNRQEQQR